MYIDRVTLFIEAIPVRGLAGADPAAEAGSVVAAVPGVGAFDVTDAQSLGRSLGQRLQHAEQRT